MDTNSLIWQTSSDKCWQFANTKSTVKRPFSECVVPNRKLTHPHYRYAHTNTPLSYRPGKYCINLAHLRCMPYGCTHDYTRDVPERSCDISSLSHYDTTTVPSNFDWKNHVSIRTYIYIYIYIYIIYITFKEYNSELQTSITITSIITFVILKNREIFHSYMILSLSGPHR